MGVKRVAARALSAGIGVAVLLAASGCGVLIDLTSAPDRVVAGQNVTFNLTLTNPSVCPIGDVTALVAPFVTRGQLDFEGSQLGQFLSALCSGSPVSLPGGTNCVIQNGQLTCDRPGAETAPGDQTSFEASTVFGALACRQDGSKLVCDLPKIDAINGTNAAFMPPSLPCIPVGSPVTGVECGVTTLAPGASVSASFPLPAPPIPGLLNNLALAGATELGICKTGTNSGNPCGVDADCSGAMGSCASGICINDTNQALGAGCDGNGDCAMGETCTPCQTNGPAVILPIACTQTAVNSIAPALSMPGVAAAILTLLSLGFFGVLRLRRR